MQDYDGLNGKVIKWTFEHGNTNHDPGILAWVLGPDGAELGRAEGKISSASSFAGWLQEMGKASFPLVDPSKFTALKAEARSVAARKNLGSTLASLRKKAESATGSELDEARELLTRLVAFADFQAERAKALEDSAPKAALDKYREIAAQFKGDQVGDEAESRRKSLEKSPEFMKEVKACAILGKMTEIKGQLSRERPMDSPGNRKVLDSLRALMQALEKGFQGTKTLEKARAMMKELGS